MTRNEMKKSRRISEFSENPSQITSSSSSSGYCSSRSFDNKNNSSNPQFNPDYIENRFSHPFSAQCSPSARGSFSSYSSDSSTTNPSSHLQPRLPVKERKEKSRGNRKPSKVPSSSPSSGSSPSSRSHKSRHSSAADEQAALECARARDLELWTRWRCQMNDALISDFVAGDRKFNGTIVPIEEEIRNQQSVYTYEYKTSRNQVDELSRQPEILRHYGGESSGLRPTQEFLHFGIPRAKCRPIH